MFRDVAFGQYYPADSFVHKMDPRVKIILSLCYLVGIIFINSFFGFAIITVALILAFIFSKVPVKSVFRSIKPIIFLIVFTTIINLLFVNDGRVIAEWWIIKITEGGLIFSGRMVLRLLYLVLGASFLTLTTTPVDLSSAIGSLLSPLYIFRIPVHIFSLIMSITLCFIPSLMEEADRIIRAQKARCANFESGNIFKRAKAFIPILIPLLIGAFRRAEDLALAMESRCFGAVKRPTKMKKMKVGLRDLFGAIFFLAIFAVMLYVRYTTSLSAFPWMYI